MNACPFHGPRAPEGSDPLCRACCDRDERFAELEREGNRRRALVADALDGNKVAALELAIADIESTASVNLEPPPVWLPTLRELLAEMRD